VAYGLSISTKIRDVECRNARYFVSCHRIRCCGAHSGGQLRHSGWSENHTACNCE